MATSTRRFVARPASVELDVTGSVSPSPSVCTRALTTPWLTRYAAAAAERRRDKSSLYAVVPTLSVWPMISRFDFGY